MIGIDGCLLDVSANIGYYTCYMYPTCSRIFAFEPDRRMRAILEQNVIGLPNRLIYIGMDENRLRSATYICRES